MTAICPVTVLSLGCLAGRTDASHSPFPCTPLVFHSAIFILSMFLPSFGALRWLLKRTLLHLHKLFLSARSNFQVSEVGTNCWAPEMILLTCHPGNQTGSGVTVLPGRPAPYVHTGLQTPEFPITPVCYREGHPSWSVPSQLKISMMKANGTKLKLIFLEVKTIFKSLCTASCKNYMWQCSGITG